MKQREWSSAQVAEILTVGCYGARLAGVRGEDQEDCAAAFVAHVWQKREQIARTPIPVEKEEAFLRRCAYRFAISWARRERRHPVVTAEETVLDGVLPNPCERVVLSIELYEAIGERLRSLAPQQQTLFVRCYLHAEAREAVAQEIGCSENAVKKAAQRARGQLQNLLQQAGWSEASLREYLA